MYKFMSVTEKCHFKINLLTDVAKVLSHIQLSLTSYNRVPHDSGLALHLLCVWALDNRPDTPV